VTQTQSATPVSTPTITVSPSSTTSSGGVKATPSSSATRS
jgi:hypothetical protein